MRVYIFGNVQGIMFRKHIEEQANKLGLKGYVRNKEDGSVEAWFEGNGKEVNDMVSKCKEGPKHAVIQRLDIVDEKVQDMKGFKILRI